MLSEESDNEDIHQLTINEHFAKAYDYRKEREELAKLKEKYGSDADEDDVDEDSEEAESEDEDGEELTPAVDAAILRTLARIRRKDPSIYESGKDVFEEEKQRTREAAPTTRTKADKSKPLTMKQHALASALDPSSRSPSPEPLTHVVEQAALRKETISAFHSAVEAPKGSDADDDDDFLVPREKTKDEIEKEEEEYRQFLEREVGEDLKEIVTLETSSLADEVGGAHQIKEEETGKKKRKRKEKAKVSKGEEDQEFLMNYILNRGWIDRSARRLPTYKDIVGSKSKKDKGKVKFEDDGSASSSASAASDAVSVKSEPESDVEGGVGELDEDEFDEVADRFESSYNFRFEEPGAAEIARYPRNIDSLVRRPDTVRKEAREKRKARKEEELLKKREEVKRLKALKMRVIQSRLEKIGKEGGKSLESRALQELDLDGDWDPDAHDRQMRELYEREADVDAAVDDEKPTWDDDIDITDIAPPSDNEDDGPAEASSSKKKKKKKKKEGKDDVDMGGVDIDEMDAEVERAEEQEWDGSEEMRKRALEKYMDELYELEFNDIVGDLPTRFKYTHVAPQNFGLSSTEILMATDGELNQFMGIKKYAPYRKEGKGKNWDQQRTARLRELKEKLQDRGVDPGDNSKARQEKPKKRKGKKERMREKATKAAGGTEEAEEGEDAYDGQDVDEEAGRKPKRVKIGSGEEAVGNGDDASTKKKRRRHKKSHHATSMDEEP